MGLKSSRNSGIARGGGLTILLPALLLVLSVLFFNDFLPGLTLFSNDGPLGQQVTACHHLPDAFGGTWEDVNTIGVRGGAFPSITYGLLWLLGPVTFSKFYAPLTLLILGLGAWCFLRQIGLAPIACILGGLVAALNSSFFSAACWGVGTHPLTVGMEFFALAALADNVSPRRWLRVVLAGFAVGMGVMEGADIGAIFSIYIAAFVLYQAWISDGPRVQTLALGVSRIALVALFSAFLAFHAISVLVTTQIKGVVGTQQDKETKQQHWDFATQWSLPKREALGFLVPGLFGYRMDTRDGGAYWGAVGRDPNWDRYFASGKQGQPPGGMMRFGGGSPYAGTIVLLIAAWAVFQSLRKKDSPLLPTTRRWIWFWTGVFLISLLFAFGRFAPFYQLVYALPYFSTIRNPAKFTYLCNWALVVLFGYGVNGLYRLYMEPLPGKGLPFGGVGQWWQKARGFDRRWAIGCAAALGIAGLAWLIFASSGDAFERYLQEVQFEPAMAHLIARFSVGQAGVFLLFLAAAILLIILTLSGAFRGKRAIWGAILLAILGAVDLGRANLPWIVTWDYVQKYASNPILDILRQQPYEHRVGSLPRWLLAMQLPPQLAETEQYFRQLYGIEWTQHHFLYYNIQTPEVIQMPRMAEDLAAFEGRFQPRNSGELSWVGRHWQLTSTRYILASAAFLDLLNQQFDAGHNGFRIVERFEIAPKPGISHPTKLEELTATPSTNGPFALFEYTRALPKAGLYSNWQISTNDLATLDELGNANFDPQNTVIVADSAGVSAPSSTGQKNAGEVKFASYSPKDMVLDATAATPAILLLNDRFDQGWKVFVDGKPQELLRCNFIMRGVSLTPGKHRVEFRFSLPMGTFYVSLSAIALALLLCGVLLLSPSSSGLGAAQTEARPASKVPVTAPS
jgi:hypothetical protein